MKHNDLMIMGLVALAIMGTVMLVGNFQSTGAVTQSPVPGKYCVCDIYQVDYGGNIAGITSERIPPTTPHTDAACNARCNDDYQYAQRNVVIGKAVTY